MKLAIVYESLQGNTQALTEFMQEYIEGHDDVCDLYQVGQDDIPDLSAYDAVFFGVYTWGDGKLPKRMRKTLTYILKESNMKIKTAAVFGTGDKTFPKYCRAVDEIEYHLTKFNVPIGKDALKIEQMYFGSEDIVEEWLNNQLSGGIVNEEN